MTRSMPALALAAILAVPAVPAGASEPGNRNGGGASPPELEGVTLGPGMGAIERGLARRGYEVTEIERYGKRYEAEARRDGRTWEFLVDRETGEIMRAEREDD